MTETEIMLGTLQGFAKKHDISLVEAIGIHRLVVDKELMKHRDVALAKIGDFITAVEDRHVTFDVEVSTDMPLEVENLK